MAGPAIDGRYLPGPLGMSARVSPFRLLTYWILRVCSKRPSGSWNCLNPAALPLDRVDRSVEGVAPPW